MPQTSSLASLLETVQARPSVQELVRIWQGHDHRPWHDRPELYLAVGKQFLSAGEVLLAHQVLSRGLEAIFPAPETRWEPGKPEPSVVDPEERDPAELNQAHQALYPALMQQKALALSQAGSTERAQVILNRLVDRGYLDGETEGLLGRTYKDQAFLQAPVPKNAQAPGSNAPPASFGRANLIAAYRSYHAGYSRAAQRLRATPQPEGHLEGKLLHAAIYNGINAATCSFLLGEKPVAEGLAASVDELAERQVDKWSIASQAEARLLLGILKPEAEREDYFRASKECYENYVQEAGSDFRDISTTRRQAGRILRHARAQGIDPPFDESLFKLPTVVCHAAYGQDPDGHCDETCPHLGERDACYQNQRSNFDAELKDITCLKAVATVSCPAEILFVEAYLQRRDELAVNGKGHAAGLHLVLPYELDRIKEKLKPYWSRRIDLLIAEAANTETLGQHHYDKTSITDLRAFAALYALGLAHLQADTLDTIVHSLETPASPLKDCPLQPKAAKAPSPPAVEARALDSGGRHYRYLPILFSDVARYSQLDDRSMLRFAKLYSKIVQKILSSHQQSVLFKRTQGDSVLLTFKSISEALNVARELRDGMKAHPWTEEQFPWPLMARIALDAGPCCDYKDRLIKTHDLCGRYVNRAARLEPITPPGEIYASQTFTALARLELKSSSDFHLLGRRLLPKGFGDMVVYHVR